MYDFDYQRPDSLARAIDLLAGDDMAMPIAGGMTLLPTLKLRMAQATQLVDLAGIGELRGIAGDAGMITVGAMTPHAEVANHPLVNEHIPALAGLAAGIGDPQVRNRGTLGGSLANNDPAADYPAAVLGLNATVVTDRRALAADDYFLGMFTTALEPGEIITQVRFSPPRRAAYAKFRNPAS
ncbi:MAG: FAD binding domain-containing protein, partial [Pseudomonadota bacterium]